MSKPKMKGLPKYFKGRHWCLTINNPSDYIGPRPEKGMFLEKEMEYIVSGKEIGDNGTPHYQCYVCFLKRKSMLQVKKIFFQTPLFC